VSIYIQTGALGGDQTDGFAGADTAPFRAAGECKFVIHIYSFMDIIYIYTDDLGGD